MAEEILKHTKSLSPVSLETINAKIVSDGNNVYMVKKDEKGQEYRALIEKDKGLYLLLTELTGKSSAEIQFIHTYVSSKCNLNCQVCYESYGDHREIGLDEVKQLFRKYSEAEIVLTGMEPTCRENIVEFLETSKNRNSLVTNGIKLESLEYLRKLKDHGLKKIFFSFNGFDDEIYRKMNGKNLLETKLKALKCIENEKIKTLLSATVVRGVNENQILPLVKFCFDHRSFIIQLRLRTLAPIGKYINGEQICMSELIGLIADSLAVEKEHIIREFRFVQKFMEYFRWLLPKGIRDKYQSKVCSFIFNIKKEKGDRYSSPGSQIDLERINRSSFKFVYFFYYLIRAYGILMLMETALHSLNLRVFATQKKILNIALKCWPNLYNVDLAEMNKCPTVFYKDEDMEKFCLSNIKNSARKEKEK